MVKIESSLQDGFEAWQLESERLAVTLIPALGGKLVSLVDRQAGYEWLVGPMRPLRKVPYASRFVDQDMSGWDEMFPTIDACPYPAAGPYAGRALPDHGEVWALPWEWVEGPPAPGAETLSLSVQGVALPYRLERRLSFGAPDCLRMEYTLHNLGEEPLSGLWAAHPQFTSEPGTRVILPDSVNEVINVVAGERWGEIGRRHSWPKMTSLAGEQLDLKQAQVGPTGSCRKFYLPPDQPVGWARLLRPQAKSWLALSWSTAELPYLGLWFDEGAFNQAPAVALEPSNGYYDRLDRAWQNGRCLHLPPGEARHWELRVQVGGEA